ncbi:MAG: MOSC domain-containing protein [Sporomusaceae bacterium]|nr:MOSC domain-containing protein [Sporomusaceae bacterium]
MIAVNCSTKKGVVKKPILKGYFKMDHGLEGDAHGGNWHRQVSLLGRESIAKVEAVIGHHLSPGVFAENITTEGICLYTLPIGTCLKIGNAVLEVTQIGKECHSGCAIRQQTGDCVMPREGIFAKVVQAGSIQSGDSINIME